MRRNGLLEATRERKEESRSSGQGKAGLTASSRGQLSSASRHRFESPGAGVEQQGKAGRSISDLPCMGVPSNTGANTHALSIWATQNEYDEYYTAAQLASHCTEQLSESCLSTFTRCSQTAVAAQVLAVEPVLPGICQQQASRAQRRWTTEHGQKVFPSKQPSQDNVSDLHIDRTREYSAAAWPMTISLPAGGPIQRAEAALFVIPVLPLSPEPRALGGPHQEPMTPLPGCASAPLSFCIGVSLEDH